MSQGSAVLTVLGPARTGRLWFFTITCFSSGVTVEVVGKLVNRFDF